MSCKALKLKGCEVAGSTFNGRKFTFTDRQINQDTFTAKVYNFARVQLVEIQGVKNESDVYFTFAELEAFPVGSYKIEYWANLNDVGIEMIAIEDFKISREPCNCDESSDVNYTLEFKEETVSYSLSIAIVNIGGGISGGTPDWDSITNKPSLFPPSAHTHGWNEITNKPDFFSGNYDDLNSKPSLFSGDYNDLQNKPVIPAEQVNSDWNATSGKAQILNKPTLFSGSYNDLQNKPTIPTAQINSDWNATSGVSQILNKPNLFDGTWNSLSGKPSTFTPPVATDTVLGGVKIWTGTQAAYDAISTKDSATLYFIN